MKQEKTELHVIQQGAETEYTNKFTNYKVRRDAFETGAQSHAAQKYWFKKFAAEQAAKDEQAYKALKLISSFDFKLLKKQRQVMAFLSASKIIPTKYNDVLIGLDNGLYSLAEFAVDVLGKRESTTLLVAPNFRSEKAEREYHKKENAKEDAEMARFIKVMEKKLADLKKPKKKRVVINSDVSGSMKAKK